MFNLQHRRIAAHRIASNMALRSSLYPIPHLLTHRPTLAMKLPVGTRYFSHVPCTL